MVRVRFDPGNERVCVEKRNLPTCIECNRFPRGIPPSPWVPANRGDNLRRLDAAAWSNPRYQPIGSRLRGLERRTKGSLPIEREAAVIAMQGPAKTPATYIRSAPRHRLLPLRVAIKPLLNSDLANFHGPTHGISTFTLFPDTSSSLITCN